MFHKMSDVPPEFFDLYHIEDTCRLDVDRSDLVSDYEYFLAFELVKDNKGMTDTDPEFRKLYGN